MLSVVNVRVALLQGQIVVDVGSDMVNLALVRISLRHANLQ